MSSQTNNINRFIYAFTQQLAQFYKRTKINSTLYSCILTYFCTRKQEPHACSMTSFVLLKPAHSTVCLKQMFIPLEIPKQKYKKLKKLKNNGRDLEMHTIHSPKFHLPIISSRHNQRECRMERGPINTPVMTFQDILHNSVNSTKEICIHLTQS